MSQYLNPKFDFIFKKVFGSLESKSILISFLNAFLVQAGLKEITDLEILNPYLPAKILDLKDSYVDIKATTSDGRIVIIEMQMLSVAGFEKRILYNTSKAYSGQIDKGEDYPALFPVISLTFCDFNLFSDKDYFHQFKLYDTVNNVSYSDEMNLVFIELRKVDKSNTEIVSLAQEWLDFLNQTEKIKPKNTEISKALKIIERAGLNKIEIDELENLEMYAVDYQRALVSAENKGILLGKLEGKLEAAKNMLKKGYDLSVISDITGLSINEIKALK